MKVTYEMENGKKVKVKTYVDGSVYKYDENGNEIYHKDNDGYECWKEYDANGNKIHYKNRNGCEKWWDSNGNCIHIRNNDGEEWFCDDYKERKSC